jgi:DNA-binding helix-hairpin-helix protein with protein kinase domain/Flp pilus assembly protein TadD
MPTFYDSNKNSYVLTQEIGRGGEGTVYHCPNDSSLVAKIYHQPVTDEKAEKLRWMAANKNDQLLKIAAWIVDTLTDEDGKIVGFLMPNVKAKEIHELYSLKSRRVHFPQATWQYLIHTATNVARAFYVLHKNEHIMGDVNHGNLVVLADGRVNLIDCDSYSIKTDKMRYRCEVGVATHLAPELQGIDLGEIEREKNHDNFGLAVIIFQLLFLGRHPFAGNYLGAEDKSLEDCIRERRFAYGNRVITNVKQPPGTLSLSQIPPRLATMFTSAFMTNNRPEPHEWIEALGDLSKNLKTCHVHTGHHFSEHLGECPWCRMEAKTGLILFPLVSGNGADEGKFNILTVENLINQMLPSQNLPLEPAQFQVVAQSSAEALNVKKSKRDKIVKIIFGQFLFLSFFSLIFGGVLAFLFGLIFLGIAGYIFSQQHNVIKNEFQRKFRVKQDIWRDIETEWNGFIGFAEKFGVQIDNIKRQINEYRNLQEEKAKQIKQLTSGAFQNQLQQYLSGFKLDDLKDSAIEKVHYEIFKRYNLETAADIDEHRLPSLLAINVQVRMILIQWRETLESQFTFDTNEHLPVAAKNRLDVEFNDKRQNLESNIEKMLGTLRRTSTSLEQKQQKLANNAENSYREVIQAQRDLITVGGSAGLTVLMILLTIFVPAFGSILINAFFSKKSSVKNYPPPMSTPRTVSVSSNVSPRAVPVEDYSNYPVKENLTDAEIAKMSGDERYKSAQSLYSHALSLMDEGNYNRAEKKLRLAVKLIDYDTVIMNSLAKVLHEQKKYDESLKVLEKSLTIYSENEEAKLLIGANYLKMKRYDEAKDLYLKILTQTPKSFEAYFNLGLINKELGNYGLAESDLQEAVKLKPDDSDALYEYGIALYKNGKVSEAEKEYYKLYKLNAEKAEKLRKKIIGVQKPPKFESGRGSGIGTSSGSGYYIK